MITSGAEWSHLEAWPHRQAADPGTEQSFGPVQCPGENGCRTLHSAAAHACTGPGTLTQQRRVEPRLEAGLPSSRPPTGLQQMHRQMLNLPHLHLLRQAPC